MRSVKGYLTIYMSLVLTLLMSLFLVMIDGVRRNGAALEAVCVAEAGIHSIFAEYHRELMERYNLFAIDSSYGTGKCTRLNTGDHLTKYIERNLSYDDIFLSKYRIRDLFDLSLQKAEVTHMSVLTDEKGAVFRKQAILAVEDEVGLRLFDQLMNWCNTITVNGLENPPEEEDSEELDEAIGDFEGAEVDLPEDENIDIGVFEDLENRRSLGIWKLVFEDESVCSRKVLEDSVLIYSRMENGNVNRGDLAVEDKAEDLLDRFMFQEYLIRYLDCFRDGEGQRGQEKRECPEEQEVRGKTHALDYQVEYLIAGSCSDMENLKSVLNRLCVLREASNLLYLLADQEKRKEIEAVATVLCTILLVPELIPVAEALILSGWSFAESVYDIKSLLQGGKIPLLKDDDSWHYSLGNALAGNLADISVDGDGLSYEDYLRIFMMFTDLDTLTGRAMNMIESDIRLIPGNKAFRLDGCYDRIVVKIQIQSGYGGDFEIVRERGYR